MFLGVGNAWKQCPTLLSSSKKLARKLSPVVAAAASTDRRTLYPVAEVLDHGYLKVTDGHELYYEIRGTSKPDARTALFLHGGPGAGCFPRHAAFFNPTKWRVVLLDQRGCGRSIPCGSLIGNETPNLLQDLETLRKHIFKNSIHPDSQQWDCVLGGSWGSTLALAYAQAFPCAIRTIILRGVCAMRTKEIHWLFSPMGGAATLAPHAWRDFASLVKQDENNEDAVLDGYYQMLANGDDDTRARAVRSWMTWESQVSALAIRRPAILLTGPIDNKNQINLSRTSNKKTANPLNPSAAYLTELEATNQRPPYKGSPQPLLTCHYSVHRGFFDQESDLFANLHRIQHIPTIAVQGGNDHICPPTTAFEFYSIWPELELRLVPGAGHSQYDPDIMHELVSSTDEILTRLKKMDDDDINKATTKK